MKTLFCFLLPMLILSLFAYSGRCADVAGSVHSITLPHFEAELPVAPGRKAFVAACVSCHSARYVFMQPKFPQKQWEETVGKMIKVYGAHLDTNQLREIVGYLVAVNGVTTKGSAEISTLEIAQSPDAPAPILAIPNNSETLTAGLKRGAELFAQNCAGCHGASGKGDGIASPVLLPRPANLAGTQFSVELLSDVLWNGVPGTAMPSWRDLSVNDLNALAIYVQSLHPAPNRINISADNSARGKILFAQVCAACHGPLGDGKSTTAATLAPPPTDLTREQPDLNYVLQVLRDGVPGTAMPAMQNLFSEPDRAALANYVRTLFRQPTSTDK
jgi:mono/diheme cytochrome c family protein